MLDSAEHGETIVVTRGGRRVAAITPIPAANGADLRAVFERWRSSSAIDDDLASRVEAVRDAASGELDRDPWRD